MADQRVAGVAFTGSTETAKIIQMNLAKTRRYHAAIYCRNRRSKYYAGRLYRLA